ncbi:hypothetical protein [Candidatus Hecatella orcuttiae]|jgi:hypothetical protein|uniref:hypothetical protein n=1 Tax=Candidatus Hecatella orcuttiae TaxID=1935119 RepID=UPI002867E238|nr:hypothetical protein [Candidatus Hecatella orcuttiae]
MSEKTPTPSPREDVFAIMERKDEDQIIAELKGAYLDEFVYSFEHGDRRVVGLSWSGVKEIAWRLGSISVDDLTVEDKGDFWLAKCSATDHVRGNRRWGAAVQPKKIGDKEDVFALPKAVSKAQRNAIRAVIPEAMIKTFIDRFLEESRTKQPSPTPSAEVKTAAEKSLAANNLGEITELKANDVPLAILTVKHDEAFLTPQQKFHLSTPPWGSFFVAKVLEAMVAKDAELAMKGEIGPTDLFSYNIDEEGGILREVYVRNWRTKERLSQIKNAARWTLSKMLERSKTPQAGGS